MQYSVYHVHDFLLLYNCVAWILKELLSLSLVLSILIAGSVSFDTPAKDTCPVKRILQEISIAKYLGAMES